MDNSSLHISSNYLVSLALIMSSLACEPTDSVSTDATKAGNEASSGGISMVTGGVEGIDETAGESRSGQDLVGDTTGTVNELCRPTVTDWPKMEPIINDHCGLCHGTEPKFGASFSLMNYEVFTAEQAELVAKSLSNGTMPPAGQEPLNAEDRMSLYNWLSCGDLGEIPEPVPAGGFSSTRPLLEDNGELPDNVDFFELRADSFTIPNGRTDRYECFTISAPVSEERFIRRVETIVDDARILHHIVVIPDAGGREPGTHSKCDEDNPFNMIYAWAPGQGALQFAEGGIRLSPGQAITLQVHYNNSGQYEDTADRSGVRIYHGPTEGPEVAVLSLGPVGFEIAPRSREEVTGYCELPQGTSLIASFPHMHENGMKFQQSVTRDWLNQNEEEEIVWEDVITLDGWDFESQYVYDTPMDFARGDLIKTSCVYENNTDEPVRFGENTANEMCFNFAYISPPISVSLCNQSSVPAQKYIPGECAPQDSENWAPPPVEVRFEAGEARQINSSLALPTGRYWIDEAIAVVPSNIVERYRFDLEQSGARGRGIAVWAEDQKITLDLNSEMRLVASGLSFTERLDLSLQGQISLHQADEMNDEASGSFDLDVSCGDLDNGQIWVNLDPPQANQEQIMGGWVEFPIGFGPIDLIIRIHLRRLE
ncbi:MAG: hypothetical protein CMH49_00760 [Myxococcales bacterium]|nr:hypothetical protein [Myxococcales bacterium]